MRQACDRSDADGKDQLIELPIEVSEINYDLLISMTMTGPAMRDDILPHLPPSTAWHALSTLIATLPPPVIDTPETRHQRDDDAIAAVVALQPANAADAMLAVQIVLANAEALYCLHLAIQPGLQPEFVRRYRIQAASFMRIARSSLRLLAGPGRNLALPPLGKAWRANLRLV